MSAESFCIKAKAPIEQSTRDYDNWINTIGNEVNSHYCSKAH